MLRRREAIESQEQLADRYSDELWQLVYQGEISLEFAERVKKDMFEEVPAGERPRLRWSVWRAYVSEFTGDWS